MSASAPTLSPIAPPGPATATPAPDGPVGDEQVPGADRCPSCGAERPRRFCAECGEARVEPRELTLTGFAGHAAGELTNLDGTLWRTVRLLVRRPGQLTVDWAAGRRRGLAKPLQLFVLANVLFFLVAQATVGDGLRYKLAAFEHGQVTTLFLNDTLAIQRMVAAKAARAGITRDAYARRFDAASAAQGSIWLLVAPVFACAVATLNVRRRVPFGVHLTFSAHYFSFFLLAASATFATLVPALRAYWRWDRAWTAAHGAAPGSLQSLGRMLATEAILFWPVVAAVALYLVLALRRVYVTRWRTAAAQGLALAFLTVLSFKLYRSLLFAITFWTT